jgi:hypothetical protein
MTELANLHVEVRDRDITITAPGTPHEVTYRKDVHAPVLVATDTMRNDPDRHRARFLVHAWKAAYAEAKSLGWL